MGTETPGTKGRMKGEMGIRTKGYLQNSKFARSCHQNREKKEADDKTCDRGQVATTKDEKPVPSTH